MSVAIVPTARPGKTGKIVAASEAARLIRTGDTVAIGGFFGIGLAMEIIHALAAIYEESDTETASLGKPRDLTLVWCVSPGDGQQRGAQRLAQPGLIKRLIGGHWTAVPALYQLVAGNQVEGYNIPLGPRLISIVTSRRANLVICRASGLGPSPIRVSAAGS